MSKLVRQKFDLPPVEGNSWSGGLPINALEEQADLDLISALRGAAREAHPVSAEEGQLCVDVAQTKDELIVVAAMAGAPPERLELHLHNDLLTIRGERPSPVPAGAEHFHQETYWGKFSRSIVLPVDVKHELSRAEYRNGLLIIRLPKVLADKSIPIMVVEE